MKPLVVVGADVAAGEDFLEMLEECRVDGHDVLEMAMNGAVLHHQDLAVALQNGGLDFADLLGQQHVDVLFSVQNRLTRFTGAFGTERVSLPRPAQRRLRFLIRLEKRLLRPLRGERGVLMNLVQTVEDHPGAVGGDREALFDILHWLRHGLNNRRYGG